MQKITNSTLVATIINSLDTDLKVGTLNDSSLTGDRYS